MQKVTNFLNYVYFDSKSVKRFDKINVNHVVEFINMLTAEEQARSYRYNTRFGIPVYDEEGNLERYNILGARMLVRCDEDGKLYLYDLVRTKKETSEPHEQ